MPWYKKKKAKTSRQKLIDKLDTYFSKYIRIRDANEDGLVKCITCGHYDFIKEVDCGHFMPRDQYATRWEEKNCNGQCRHCNRFKDGKQYEHGLAIDKKWGKGTAEKMLIKSKSVCKFQDFELEEMIETYKQKIKELGEEKTNFGHRTPTESGCAI